jgi:transposase
MLVEITYFNNHSNAKAGNMTKNIETIKAAVAIIIKAAVLAASFSGRVRKRSLKRLSKMDIDDKDKEILFLRDKNYQLKLQVSIYQKGLQKNQNNKRFTLSEKLFILNYMEAFQIPRRRVTEHLGIARSTLYGWLHKIEEQVKSTTPVNKTPTEIASLIWKMAKDNVGIGRVRIANQLGLLNIFISASTVRNILNRPKPKKGPKSSTKSTNNMIQEQRSIPAWYSNHVWSIDTTEVRCWGIWIIHVFVVIDHYSRKVMAVIPLEGPNAYTNYFTIYAYDNGN